MRHMTTQHCTMQEEHTHCPAPLQHPDPLPHVDVLLLAAVNMQERDQGAPLKDRRLMATDCAYLPIVSISGSGSTL